MNNRPRMGRNLQSRLTAWGTGVARRCCQVCESAVQEVRTWLTEFENGLTHVQELVS